MSSFTVTLEGFLNLFPSHRALHRRIAELEALALTDALTGLPNRRAFDRVLERESAQATRNNSPLSLAVFDLDHFKQVNDTYGHQTGDAVLKKLGDILREQMRTSDFAARIGGEEFALVLFGTGLQGAYKFVDRLREKIAHDLEVIVEGKKVKVTASFGVTQMTREEVLSRFVSRADDALYRAKGSGRNRVSPLPDPKVSS